MSGDRPVGMGIGQIPFTAMDTYARRYGIDDVDDFDRFVALIRAQDAEFIRIKSRKPGENVVEEVAPEDTDGVKSLFHRLAAKSTESEQPQRLTIEEPDH